MRSGSFTIDIPLANITTTGSGNESSSYEKFSNDFLGVFRSYYISEGQDLTTNS